MSCWNIRNPVMVVALLANLEIHIWLLSRWNIKSPDMVDVLLEHKKSSYGCCLAGNLEIQIWLMS